MYKLIIIHLEGNKSSLNEESLIEESLKVEEYILEVCRKICTVNCNFFASGGL
jgi:hypothetical protein